ncbi:MAG TPA: T9SS type A sorting domain-containing protein, partial [Puia sp.]|nr:T9SS type A sorting domain-containing protein [Puia sp.]
SGDKLSLYPNPARETINIVNPSGLLIRGVRIYNTVGVEVKRFDRLTNNTTIQLPIGDLPAGLYTLQLFTDNGAEVLKVMK